MTSKLKKLKRELWHHPPKSSGRLLLLIIILIIFIGIPCFFVFFYRFHFLPQTSLQGIDISHLNHEQALEKVKTLPAPDFALNISYQDYSIASSSSELNASYNVAKPLATELQKNKSTNVFELLSALANQEKNYLYPEIELSQTKTQELLDNLAGLIYVTAQDPTLELAKTGQAETLKFAQGEDGVSLDSAETLLAIQQALVLPNQEKVFMVEAQPIIQKKVLSETEIAFWQAQAQKLVGQKLAWRTDQVDNFSFELNDQDLISYLSADGTIKNELISQEIATLAQEIDRQPTNPVFDYDPQSLKVINFSPPQTGLKLNQATLLNQVQQALTCWLAPDDTSLTATSRGNQTGSVYDLVANSSAPVTIVNQDKNGTTATTATKNCSDSLELILEIAQPEISLAETNDLGINEEIGFGESYYYHSIAGRIHNVALASSRLNLALIAPGQEFSFNRRLGDISAKSGYKNGWIIQGGRSVLSPGGGVCQVSSTLFRALLDSGVKVTLRLPHAYRVSYYELHNDPGFDATVYAGNVDLRFINDTPGYILIYAQTDSANTYMTVRLYGTSDGRTTEIVDYQKYGQTAPPATQYIDDPSLPVGKTEKIDSAIAGLKVKYTNIIRDQNGREIRRDDYFSSYQAWSAKYLVGTGQ